MIYTIKRNGVVIFTHEIRGSRTQSAPAVDFVDVEFDFSEAILLKNNDTIEFDGQTYYCDKQYNSVLKRGLNLYNHRARFLSENYRATEIALLDAQGLSTFEIEGNLLTLLTLAETNLNRLSSGWSYDTPPTTITKTFQIDGMNVMEFLARVSSEFEIPFYIQDKVIYFKDPDLVDGGRFEYGKGNGFIDIRKSYKSGEKIPNTVYATGGDGLVLDTPVVNSGNIADNGVIEGFYENENIRPTTRVQMQGVVSSDNVVTTTQINYDIQAQKIAGQTPLINFETGALGGLSFYITNSTWDTNTNVTVVYLKKRTVDGVLLPNNTARALAGDYFNITNIRQPQVIVDEALFKLGQYATADMNQRILNNMSVEVTLDPLFTENLKLNDSISVGDDNLELAGRWFILEIKTDLQNLNKKDIVLGKNFRYLNIPGLNVKNENIIDLGIQNNYDDLVVIEEEIVTINEKLEVALEDISGLEVNMDDVQNVKLPQLTSRLTATEIDLDNVQTVQLPLKENTSNKVNILEIESPTAIMYPDALSVKQGFNLKQNKLIQGSNISIVSDTISVPNATSSQAGAVQLFSNTTQTQPANAPTSVPNQTYGVQTNSAGQMVVNVPHVSYSDLDGFIYDVTYNSTTHTITFYQQNEPNIVIDLPIESLIKGVQLVGDDLVFTFEDGSTVTVPLNTLLVGVVKSVNGLTPNSNGEVVVNIGDIPALSSTLSGKANVNGNNITNATDWRTNLDVYSTTQVDVFLAGKANTSGYYSGLSVGNADNATRWNNQIYFENPVGSFGIVSALLSFDPDNNIWRKADYLTVINWLGINTSWNLQQVTNNGTSTTNTVDFRGGANITDLFFKNNSQSTGVYLASLSNGDLFIGKHSNYSWTGDLGYINYNGTFQWNGTIATASHGTSADWNAKVSQSQLANYVNKAGDVMSGLLKLPRLQVYNSGNGNERNYFIQTNVNTFGDLGIISKNATETDNFRYDVVIYGNGNVGIGETDPQAKLHVNGNIITDNATASNHAVAFGQLANYALSSAIPTNVSQLINDANYTTLPIVQSWVGTQAFGGITSTNITNWNTAFGWGNHAGLYPLLSGSYANPTWITSLDWSKISNAPTIPSAPNNGTFTVQGTGSLTGSGSTSANASANTSATLDLTAQTKADINQGKQAGKQIGDLFGSLSLYPMYHDVSSGSTTVDPNEAFFNLVNPKSTSGISVEIINHSVNGARLVLQGVSSSSSGIITYTGRFIDRNGTNVNSIVLENNIKEYYFDTDADRWREVF